MADVKTPAWYAFLAANRWALVAGCAFFVLFGVFYFRNRVAPSSVPPPPRVESSATDVSKSAVYREKVAAEQRRAAQAAARTGKSYVASPNTPAHMEALLAGSPTPRPTVSPTPTPTPRPRSTPDAALIKAMEEARQREQAQVRQRRRTQQSALFALQAAAAKNIERQMGQLVGAWKADGLGTVELAPPKGERTASAGPPGRQAAAGAGARPDCGVPGAGTIAYGVTDTEIDSDVPSPVVVRIETDKLRGSKLLGAFKRVQDKGVILSFDTMVNPAGASCQVKAVALNPDTTGAAIETAVNHHYLERYGMLLASAFAQGYGEAIMAANTTYQIGPMGNTTAITTIPPGQEFIYALGQVGQTVGAQAQSFFNIPPTVKVSPGTAIAILFLGAPQPGAAPQASPAPTPHAPPPANASPASAYLRSGYGYGYGGYGYAGPPGLTMPPPYGGNALGYPVYGAPVPAPVQSGQ